MFSPPLSSPDTLHPLAWYAHLRATEPVSRPHGRGPWQVVCYDDVKRVLSDHTAFSSAGGAGEPTSPLGASLVSTDPPRHRHLRALVTQAFTPSAVAALVPRITAIVDDLLDDVVLSGRMDAVDDLAYPLPVIVIAELLGIPSHDRARFKQWSDAIVAGPSAAGMAGRDPQAEMSAYFRHLLAQRRTAPQEDLLSALLAARVEGAALTEMEVLGFCVLLLVAGNETTTNLIANALWCFDAYPEVRQQVVAAPELLPSAIEEVLRYTSPVRGMFRTAAVETALGGQTVGAGDGVVAWIAAANHDPAQFPQPERFEVTRQPNRHLAFGQGIHYCLGAPLARLEAKIALGRLLRRCPDLERDQDVPLVPLEGGIVAGVRHLPLRFTPHVRLSS
jgi:cytochrome P450